ncbi:hypothetical protein R5W23_004898 [Gemmata sp. JC673]|uniref:Uncharacterized protein n=1 Tax=Gemmata algarum TaxID=2975278 RepID=A0ABU5F723_9BACT|nr:hypothetical protein [Gemmata algarum]MDY3563395.1 hypothetical protein [Gemmata algarum]
MRLSGRIEALTARVACRPAAGPAPPLPDWLRDRTAFLALVPEALRERMAARLDEPYGPDSESLASWVGVPFARWAPAPAPQYRLPEALVAWVLDPPRPFWFGHHCGSCGLAVPLVLVPSSDPRPLADLRAFPTCPACGGRTSHAANDRPDAPENRQ